ncbi:MAG: ArsR/SmtB family transcription factor [Cellulosilyticaceae bacterium]
MEAIGATNNCYRTYSTLIELHYLAERLWNQETDFLDLEAIYEEAYRETLCKEYSLVYEILDGLRGVGSMLEFLAESKDFEDREAYEAYVKALPKEKFLEHFFGKAIEIDVIRKACEDEKYLYELYKKYQKHIKSYAAYYMVFMSPQPFVEEYFELLEKLDTPAFQCFYETIQQQGETVLQDVEKALAVWQTPLEASEKLMGKTFGNRGPYEKFYFVPSYFMPYRVLRFNVYEDQILVLNIRKKSYTSQDAIKVMKVMADETRFMILELLAAGTPMMGRELAEKLGLSTATISHHMEQLRMCGLVTEERIKNSKYYGVATHSIGYFMDYMKRQFHM